MKRKPRATIKGGFRVDLRLEPMFTFSVVQVHQAEDEIHTFYLKCGYCRAGISVKNNPKILLIGFAPYPTGIFALA